MNLVKPIFIVGPHRSGTTLLLRLFDGHPDLFTIPFETHIFEHAGRWVDYEGRKKYPIKLDNGFIKTNYFRLVERLDKNRNLNTEKPILDSNKMGCMWDILKEKTFKDLIEKYFTAIYYSIHNRESPENIRIVEKSVEHAEFVPELKQMFPDAKFIHIVRNPYAYMNSYRSYLQKGSKKYPQLKKPLLSLKNNLYHLDKNKRLFTDDYKVIKYEDLVLNTGIIMTQIQDFLGLQDHPILYRPTLLGMEWKGNSLIQGDLNKISLKPLEHWEKTINHLEIYYINTYFDYLLKLGRYKKIKQKKHKNIPVKGEGLKTYILNRTLEYNCFTGMNILKYLQRNEIE